VDVGRHPQAHTRVAPAGIARRPNEARAAAATGVVIARPAPVPSISLDRPFLFWLRNVRTGTPIVMGRFMGGW